MTYEEAERLVLATYEKDPEAAKWLVSRHGKKMHEKDTLLSGLFVWSESPQEHDFWSSINLILYPED